MDIPDLRYGRTTIALQIPDDHRYDTIVYKRDEQQSPARGVSIAKIRKALAEPIGTAKLRDLAKKRGKAVILISDGTRLCPSPLLLEPLLDELNAGGLADDAIDIVVALGMHRKHTEEELLQLTGPSVYERIRVHNHSAVPEDCVNVGTTTLGTPVEINPLVAKADLRIVTGNIEPHSLVGISGGVKALIPGVASHTCIEHNHSLSLKYKADAGSPDNPIHRDLEEALQFIPIDFMLNVIVDHERHVMDAVAGHVVKAHRVGTELAAKRFLLAVNQLYDVVVVSPGGAPKDLQLYQALKSLRNAAAFTKPGGAIIMVAECPEMLGNGIFQFWVETMPNRQHMVEKLKKQFVLGAHKVLHLDEVLQQHRVFLYSSLPEPLVRLLGFEPADDIEKTLHSLLGKSAAKLALMPFGALTFPKPG